MERIAVADWRLLASVWTVSSDHGQFFSTLDQLDTDQADRLRHCDRLWLERGHVVLCHAEVHQSRIPTDPAGAVSARYPRDTAGNGLPLLSQLRGGRRAVECAEHRDVHELPHAGGKGQSKAAAGAGELEKR